MSRYAGPFVPAGAAIAPRAGIRAIDFTRAEWWRLGGFYGVIALLHVAGWGLYLHHAARYPALVGLGFAAYMFGLRHAFDADHIAAVDDTVRFQLQKGRRPLGTGFFFSLGHSTVVLALALGIALAAGTVAHALPALRAAGTLVGTSVSGAFLWAIGVLNLFVLLDLLDVWHRARRGGHSHAHLEELLRRRGLMQRLFGGRLARFMDASWQMYPLGILFGLGFDTASEVGFLAMTAGASGAALPVGAVAALPLLFAAGMTLMDTTDGVLMSQAYRWALVNPLRRIFYNLATTGLSVVVALLIGTVELLQVLATVLDRHGGWWDAVRAWDIGRLGYLIVGLFLLVWVLSVLVWRWQGRGARALAPHTHEHCHDDGVVHSHVHLHEPAGRTPFR